MKIFKQSVVKWLMIALCLCLAVCSLGKNAADSPAADSPLHDIGFEFENIRYGTIGFEERIRYGLVDSGEIGLTPENTYKITRKDLGEKMGTVELPYGNGTVSADVYHFAAYPDYDSICIVDTPDGYVFYTAGWLDLTKEHMAVSDGILGAYDMPKSITALEVCSSSGTALRTITDEEQIQLFCALISGHANIGLEAKEKLNAQLWQDTYGTDEVYFDDGEGLIRFNAPSIEKRQELENTAHALWGKGERDVYICTDRGFRIFMMFHPSIRSVVIHDGYYILTEEEAAQLAELLG